MDLRERDKRRHSWPNRIKENLLNAGWWHEERRKAEDQGQLLGRYAGWMQHIALAVAIVAVLMMFFVHTRGCDYAVHEFAAGAMPEPNTAQWDNDKPMDRLCGTNTKNDEGIQVCDEKTRGK